jgi:hypothetical protein
VGNRANLRKAPGRAIHLPRRQGPSVAEVPEPMCGEGTRFLHLHSYTSHLIWLPQWLPFAAPGPSHHFNKSNDVQKRCNLTEISWAVQDLNLRPLACHLPRDGSGAFSTVHSSGNSLDFHSGLFDAVRLSSTSLLTPLLTRFCRHKVPLRSTVDDVELRSPTTSFSLTPCTRGNAHN